MNRFTLHVPAQLNDGEPVSLDALGWIESRLLDIGGGFTVTAGIGAWRSDSGQIYREPVRLYALDTDDVTAREQLRNLADAVTLALEQEAVYLTEAPILATLATGGVTVAP